MNDLETSGVKHDKDKPPMDLLDPYALEQIALVLEFGRNKYAAHNWRKGLSYSRLIAASLRHIFAIMRGENLDPETGLPHAAHLGCCAMFLIWTMGHRPDLDDRWKPLLSHVIPGPASVEPETGVIAAGIGDQSGPNNTPLHTQKPDPYRHPTTPPRIE